MIRLLYRAVVNTGRVTFAACLGQRLTPFYCADFTKHPEHPDMLEAIASVLRFPNDPNFVFRDDELSLLASDLDSQRQESEIQWSPVAAGRHAHEVGARIRASHQAPFPGLAALRATTQVQDPYASPSVEESLPTAMPFLP